APQAHVCESILALLDRMEAWVAQQPERSTRPGFPPFPGVGLVVVAAVLALTPDVPLPPVPEPVDVAERAP
ncbi:MAG: hypothetical protein QOG86_31, partial [Thermoleophilaceae bacterium]|nr:hypothetical protein [Thermoleophilaceae bacterium]